jgi:hypothetical protein
LADEFNPYREWLDLAGVGSPSYYELLSLNRFESDQQTIAAAAERATTKVRSFRPGPNARAWSQLLDEIHAAKECLCDPSHRAQYDESLRRGETAQAAAPTSTGASASPASALAPLHSELYPPGMSRPASAPQEATSSPQPHVAPQPRPRTDLDPPTRGALATIAPAAMPIAVEILPDDALPPSSAAPAMPQPMRATPVYYPSAAPTPAASAAGWAAGPSPIYDAPAVPMGYPAAMPMAYPAAYPVGMPSPTDPVAYGGGPYSPAALDPKAPIAVDGLLPPGASADTAVASYQPATQPVVSTAPSAALVASQRERQTRRGLMLAAAGGIVLLAAVAVTYILVSKQMRPSSKVLAEHDVEPSDVPVTPKTSPDASTVTKTSPQPQPLTPSPTTPAPMPDLTPTLVAPVDSTPSPPTPSPVTPPAPSPAPSPPPPTVPTPNVTRAEVQALIKALDAAKAALAEQNFKVADAQLGKAESLAKLPKHKDAVARLKEVSGYVKQFREAIVAAAQGMQAGETFKVGNSTQVAFVEATADKVVLRIAGMNRPYPYNDMPPGLALVIADFKLAGSDPMTRVVKGAYLLVHKRADSETQSKAKSLWQDAQAAGANIAHLTPFLAENYADLVKDVPAG